MRDDNVRKKNIRAGFSFCVVGNCELLFETQNFTLLCRTANFDAGSLTPVFSCSSTRFSFIAPPWHYCRTYQGMSWAGAGGPARVSPPAMSHTIGRGPTRRINVPSDGMRPDPAHQFFRGWGAARPNPLHFQNFTVPPAPAHQIYFFFGPVHDLCAGV